MARPQTIENLTGNFGNFSSIFDRISAYEQVIKAQAGVLFLRSRPGEAKTALMKVIAFKNGWKLVDFRLAQCDSSEIMGYPVKSEYTDKSGKVWGVMDYNYPRYLVESLDVPTLIVYDEMNRAKEDVRNAALQILNERQVGQLKLNKNAFFVSLGNMGDEIDGCEIEDFDNALNNRLIHFVHSLSIPEWREGYADENVNPQIISFLEAHPAMYYKLPENNMEMAFPTPRSWSNLSALLGVETNAGQMMPMVAKFGGGYVGAEAAKKFLDHLNTSKRITADDVMDRYEKMKKEIEMSPRDTRSEILNEIGKRKILKCSDDQIDNLHKFLLLIPADEVVGFFNRYIESGEIQLHEISSNKKLKRLVDGFDKVMDAMVAQLGG